MPKTATPAPREERVLAKPMIQAGVERRLGEKVLLRPDQISRLEAEGYFEDGAPKAGRGRPPEPPAGQKGDER